MRICAGFHRRGASCRILATYTCVQIVFIDRINLSKLEMNDISLLINTYSVVI